MEMKSVWETSFNMAQKLGSPKRSVVTAESVWRFSWEFSTLTWVQDTVFTNEEIIRVLSA